MAVACLVPPDIRQCTVREAGLARLLKWMITRPGSVITDVIPLRKSQPKRIASMTLTVAFVRSLPDRKSRRELVFAADSRLSSGQRLDFGKKIFGLPRSDALLGFAGDCDYAYPWLMHLRASIQTNPRSTDRRLPLRNARNQAIRIFDQMYNSIYGFPAGQESPHDDEPRVQFLFGGYSWHDRKFRHWLIYLDRENKRFQWTRCRQFHFIGDTDAARHATKRTQELLSRRGKSPAEIDFEPLEVLLDIIREKKFDGVGGAPQVAKVYEYMQTQFFSTFWDKNNYLFGRQFLAGEKCGWPSFDANEIRFNPKRASPKGDTGNSPPNAG